MTLDKQKELLSKISMLLDEAEDNQEDINTIGAIISIGDNNWEWTGGFDSNWTPSTHFAEGFGPFALISKKWKIAKVKAD